MGIRDYVSQLVCYTSAKQKNDLKLITPTLSVLNQYLIPADLKLFLTALVAQW